MAKSSFDYFRKNSKVAVVALGMLCILAFVVADPLLQWLNASQSGGPSNRRGKVAVTWDGGKLTEGELGSLVSKRNILVAFLRQVEQMGAYEAMLAGAPANLPTRVQPLRLPTEYEQGVERDVLQKKILADAARDAGMVIGDETIVDYLVALGRDRVDINAMRELISGINLGRTRATPEFVFDLLREALLAQSYLSSYAYTQATITPEQRWSDWLKVNDRVVVETAAIDVSNFVGQVEEPTESELKEYFEEYREVIAGPVIVNNRELPSPTPGFRKPAKARLQYVRTSYEDALELARDEVTEEEIAEYYEANQAQFVRMGADLLAPADDLEVVEETADVEAADAESDSAADDEQSERAGEEPSDDSSSEDESGAAEEDTSSEEESSDAAPEQSSNVPRSSPFRLASFQDEPAEDAAGDESDTDESDTEEAADEETDEASPEPPVEEESEANPLDDFMAGGDDESDADSSSADGNSPPAPAEEPEVEYQPLEEVSDEIRETLAQRKAVDNQRQKVDDLLAVLKNDYNLYFTQRIDAEAAGKEPPQPAEALIDFKKLADDNGLEFGETELLTFFEMQEMEDPRLLYYFQQIDQARPLAVQVFRRDGMELYEPDSAYDTDRNFYLVMKIEAVEESEPTLDDIRDEVVSAWKHEKAAELALAKAKELAEQASDSGRSLDDLFGDNGDYKIAESDMFAWLEPVGTSATGMYDVRLDDPGSVEGAGPDFMKAVFSLGPNEVGAALDNGHDRAYVIRVAQREKSRAELRQAFLGEWQVWPGIFSMQREHVRDTTRALVMALLGGTEPDWKRTADTSPMDREASEGA